MEAIREKEDEHLYLFLVGEWETDVPYGHESQVSAVFWLFSEATVLKEQHW